MKKTSVFARFLSASASGLRAFSESWKRGMQRSEEKNPPHSRIVHEIELHFPRFENEEKMTESEICVLCHGCCSYVTADIEKPETKERIEEYRWYLFHRNTEIFIDNDGNWQLLFKTPCNELDENGYCKVYEIRPQICRDYSAEYCSRTGKDHTHLFKTPEELTAFLKTRAGKKTASKKKKSTSKEK